MPKREPNPIAVHNRLASHCFSKQRVLIFCCRSWRSEKIRRKHSLSLQKSMQVAIKTSGFRLCEKGHGEVYGYRPQLSDTVRSIGTLILDRWVPPPGEVDNVVGGCKGQAITGGSWRQDHPIEAWRRNLECLYAILPLRPRYFATNNHRSPWQPVAALEQSS
jgi:hypothetical protein